VLGKHNLGIPQFSVLLSLNEHLPLGTDDGGDFVFPLLQKVLSLKQGLGEPDEDLGSVAGSGREYIRRWESTHRSTESCVWCAVGRRGG
jgi:hypothetical protein